MSVNRRGSRLPRWFPTGGSPRFPAGEKSVCVWQHLPSLVFCKAFLMMVMMCGERGISFQCRGTRPPHHTLLVFPSPQLRQAVPPPSPAVCFYFWLDLIVILRPVCFSFFLASSPHVCFLLPAGSPHLLLSPTRRARTPTPTLCLRMNFPTLILILHFSPTPLPSPHPHLLLRGLGYAGSLTPTNGRPCPVDVISEALCPGRISLSLSSQQGLSLLDQSV